MRYILTVLGGLVGAVCGAVVGTVAGYAAGIVCGHGAANIYDRRGPFATAGGIR